MCELWLSGEHKKILLHLRSIIKQIKEDKAIVLQLSEIQALCHPCQSVQCHCNSSEHLVAYFGCFCYFHITFQLHHSLVSNHRQRKVQHIINVKDFHLLIKDTMKIRINSSSQWFKSWFSKRYSYHLDGECFFFYFLIWTPSYTSLIHLEIPLLLHFHLQFWLLRPTPSWYFQ